MADGITLDAGSGGKTLAADDISSVMYPRSKVTLGADGSNDGDVSASNPMPVTTGHAAGGWDTARDIDLDEATPANIKASAGKVGGWFIHNAAAITMFVKLYNKATAPVIANDTPLLTIAIPAGASANVEFTEGIKFDAGIGWVATGGVADTDTTAPGTNEVVANLLYK